MCRLSIRKPLACARASRLTTTNIYICMYGWMDGPMGGCAEGGWADRWMDGWIQLKHDI